MPRYEETLQRLGDQVAILSVVTRSVSDIGHRLILDQVHDELVDVYETIKTCEDIRDHVSTTKEGKGE